MLSKPPRNVAGTRVSRVTFPVPRSEIFMRMKLGSPPLPLLALSPPAPSFPVSPEAGRHHEQHQLH